jgi:hypothetical protein
MDERIKQGIENLRGRRPAHLELGLAMYKADPALYGLDLLAAAVLNRSIILIEGFCTLMEARNYLCAAPLVRLQLDSVLRFSGAALVDDPHEFALKILAGTAVRKIKDRHGNRMTDAYLLEKLAVDYPWMPQVHEFTSGFIHLSEKHIIHTVRKLGEDGTMQTMIGPGDDHIPDEFKLEAIAAFDAITDVAFHCVASWVLTKHDPKGVAEYWKERERSNQPPGSTP